MKKKYIMAGITCIFLLISGIFYSCAYKESANSALLVSSKEEAAESGTDHIGTNLSDANTSISGVKYDKTDQTELFEEVKKKDSADAKSSDVYNANAKSSGTDSAETKSIEGSSAEAASTKSEKLSVHICGAVQRPGVYQAGEAARVYDLIEMAGGLNKDAAGDYINQAQKVTDGQRIYIPTKKEVKEISPLEYFRENTDTQQAAKGGSTSEEGSDTKLININTATAEELMELPGVGEAKAAAIIEYRTTNGSFQSINDLMKISGIKEGLFQKVEKYITVK